ncbi:bone morphogenetic protein 1 homolog [Haliotis rubra]|uniref:bone morphogenetic protein 1 homolog n=1 Tax=Haliotis rubra TaxID=36100 RepID=UPI001EE50928|nr:bone morphogenetic protein 1 homolog [Haliotis rubra]
MDHKAVIVCLIFGVVQVSAVETYYEILEGNHGDLHTPGYPDEYKNNFHKTWQLNLPWTEKKYTLTLTIEAMDIEGTPPDCYDYIKVDHKEYCGQSSKEIKVYGIESGLNIEFISDGSVVGQGFKGQYKFEED